MPTAAETKPFDSRPPRWHRRVVSAGWQLTDSVEEYANAAVAFLRERPAEHTVPLTVIEDVRAGARTYTETPLFGWWTDSSGAVLGACLHTPPFETLLTDLPEEAADELADALYVRRRSLPGVHASPGTARRFASAWAKRAAVRAKPKTEHRLYRLAALTPPGPTVPGTPRRAARGDWELLIHWYEAFADEADAFLVNSSRLVEDRLSYGGLVLWEAGGLPVAFAGHTRPVAGVARIAPVYTPNEQRRRGYGTAVTAETCRTALEAGASEVVLFTDRANPTSNSIYQRIGFRPLSDRLVLSFDRGD